MFRSFTLSAPVPLPFPVLFFFRSAIKQTTFFFSLSLSFFSFPVGPYKAQLSENKEAKQAKPLPIKLSVLNSQKCSKHSRGGKAKVFLYIHALRPNWYSSSSSSSSNTDCLR